MWVSKPVYESVPYVYLVSGVCLLGLSVYLDYWPTICLLLVAGCLVAGLVIWLRRRDYRHRRDAVDDPLQ